jgi:hypothetical protein
MVSGPHKYALVLIIIHARVIVIWLAGAVLAVQPVGALGLIINAWNSINNFRVSIMP